MPGTMGMRPTARDMCCPGHTPAWAARAWKAARSREPRRPSPTTRSPWAKWPCAAASASMPPTATSDRSKGSSSTLATPRDPRASPGSALAGPQGRGHPDQGRSGRIWASAAGVVRSHHRRAPRPCDDLQASHARAKSAVGIRLHDPQRHAEFRRAQENARRAAVRRGCRVDVDQAPGCPDPGILRACVAVPRCSVSGGVAGPAGLSVQGVK